MNQKQPGRTSRLSQTLSSVAQHTLQLHPGAQIQGRKTKNTSTQDYKRQHIKTHHPISFSKKRTRRRLGGCGIHNPRIFLRQESGPSNFRKAKARDSGATLSECNFYEKLHPTKKNPDISSEAACRVTTRMMK